MNTEPTHRLARGWELDTGARAVRSLGRQERAHWYVSECECGWSSALHETESDARRAHAEHAAARG